MSTKTQVTEPKVDLSKVRTIDYKDQKQVVAPYGKDKHSQNAKDMDTIVSYYFETKKLDHFNSDFMRKEFLTTVNVDFYALFPRGSYNDSPVHRALHALSKNDTNEVSENKDKKMQDTFARGQRAFIFKSPKVGMSYPDGLYIKNPKTKYTKGVTAVQCKAAMQRIVDRCSRRK